MKQKEMNFPIIGIYDLTDQGWHEFHKLGLIHEESNINPITEGEPKPITKIYILRGNVVKELILTTVDCDLKESAVTHTPKSGTIIVC